MLQQSVGIAIMPAYLVIFAALNIGMLELAYRRIREKNVSAKEQR